MAQLPRTSGEMGINHPLCSAGGPGWGPATLLPSLLVTPYSEQALALVCLFAIFPLASTRETPFPSALALPGPGQHRGEDWGSLTLILSQQEQLEPGQA